MAQARKLHDQYFKQAKAEGYLARSAFKLKEINQKRPLIRRGDRVLDLGCAPGSWLQVASELVGPKGVVVGLDLQAVDHVIAPNVFHLQGDIFKTEPAVLLAPAGPGSRLFDVVISDMAPITTGDGDHFKSIQLCRRMFSLLPDLLRRGGNSTLKVFEGEEYPALLKEARALFDEVKGFKPDATRDVSKEMYIIALNYKGPPPSRPAPEPHAQAPHAQAPRTPAAPTPAPPAPSRGGATGDASA